MNLSRGMWSSELRLTVGLLMYIQVALLKENKAAAYTEEAKPPRGKDERLRGLYPRAVGGCHRPPRRSGFWARNSRRMRRTDGVGKSIKYHVCIYFASLWCLLCFIAFPPSLSAQRRSRSLLSHRGKNIKRRGKITTNIIAPRYLYKITTLSNLAINIKRWYKYKKQQKEGKNEKNW